MSAEQIIKKFGSAYKLARALEQTTGKPCYVANVYRWKHRGYVPYRMHATVLEAARHVNVTLEPKDFVLSGLWDGSA